MGVLQNIRTTNQKRQIGLETTSDQKAADSHHGTDRLQNKSLESEIPHQVTKLLTKPIVRDFPVAAQYGITQTQFKCPFH